MIPAFAEDEVAAENVQEESEEVIQENKPEAIVPSYQNYIDSSLNLHLNLYQDENLEYLILNSHSVDSKKTVVLYSKGKIKRYFYSEDYRLFSIEFWDCKDKVEESYLTKIIFYTYFNEEDNTKLSYYSEQYDLLKQSLVQSFFDKKNNLVEKNEFSFIGTDEKTLCYENKYRKNRRKEYSFKYRYNSEDEIISEEEVHYIYRNGTSFFQIDVSNKKNIYEYLKPDCPPVTSFYENNVLRMKTVYTDDTSYVQNIYFDNGTIIKVEYFNGKKKSEKIYSGQDIIMVKNYD